MMKAKNDTSRPPVKMMLTVQPASKLAASSGDESFSLETTEVQEQKRKQPRTGFFVFLIFFWEPL